MNDLSCDTLGSRESEGVENYEVSLIFTRDMMGLFRSDCVQSSLDRRELRNFNLIFPFIYVFVGKATRNYQLEEMKEVALFYSEGGYYIHGEGEW